MYSSIKIGGFAIGVAACFLITLFIRDELSYDLHYPEGKRIYRVVGVFNDNGDISKSVYFAAPFARALKEDYPEIAKAGRYNASELFGAGHAEIRSAGQIENYYEEGVTYADQDLLEMLQLPMVYGDMRHALDKPNTVVITKRKADKYFPGENPLGKAIILNNQVNEPYTISGVVQDFPPTSHLRFDFLLTLAGKEFWSGEQNYWGAVNYPTYVLLNPGTDVVQLEAKMTKGVIEKYVLPMLLEEGTVNAKELVSKGRLELQPLHDIYLRSEGIHDRLSHGDVRFVWMFGAIAAFILIIACINFINLSTARSANRAKEVGLRKVVGSFRGNLISQFLSESLLFSFLSFLMGILLASLLLPYFNMLSAKTLVFPWKEWWLFPALTVAALVIGIVAGLYPSLYLSSFKPIQVLKGNIARGSKSSPLRSALVIFQFTTSIILVVGTLVIYRQMDFILHTKIGYEKEQVLLLQGTSTLEKKITTFKNELLRIPNVRHVSISDYLPIKGTKRSTNDFWKEGKMREDKPISAQIWFVDNDYIKTMGMKIAEGRDFGEQRLSDSLGVIINQSMARELNLTDPVGKVITNGTSMTVLGVVEDFHFESMKENIQPLAMRLGSSPSVMAVKVNASEMTGVIRSIEKVWKEFAPHQPIRYAFLDETYARMYDDVQRMLRIFTSFAVFAIIVACLGLFGLSAFMVEQRSKEISIRIVLGASVKSIFQMLTQNFMGLVLISFVLAAPVAWYLMQKWLEDYVYKVEIGWDVFLLTGTMSTVIALFTISYQSIRAGLVNPVKSLRSE